MNLEELKSAVRQKYASYTVEWTDEAGAQHTIELKNILLLKPDARAKVIEQVKSLDVKDVSEDTEAVDHMQETVVGILTTLSGDAAGVQALVQEIESATGDPSLAYLIHIVTQYTELTQAEKA